LQVKLCDPRLSALSVPWCKKALYKYSSFPFPFAIGPLTLPVCLSVCNVSILWPNGCMDQGVTWYGDRRGPRPHCVRRAQLPRAQKGAHEPPTARLLWPNGRPSR